MNVIRNLETNIISNRFVAALFEIKKYKLGLHIFISRGDI